MENPGLTNPAIKLKRCLETGRKVVRVAKKKNLLEQMSANPAGDWQIKDIKTLCGQVELDFKHPSHGSHYKVSSDLLTGMVTIPCKRPIKAVYIKELVKFAKAHMKVRNDRKRKG